MNHQGTKTQREIGRKKELRFLCNPHFPLIHIIHTFIFLVSLCLGGSLLLSPHAWARSKANTPVLVTVPELELGGGRKLRYEGSVSSEKEVRTKHSFWGRLVDAVAGEPEFHDLIAPYSVVTDSRDRIIVTDPGAAGIHIFDFAQHKYKFISRHKDTDGLESPQCVALIPRITFTLLILIRERSLFSKPTGNFSGLSAA